MKPSIDELYHYGVPGMKWGVRRSPEELGHNPISKRKQKKMDKIAKKKKMVSDYNKTFDKASRMSDRAMDSETKMKAAYKGLGKTLLSRIKEVSKAQKGRGSDAANEYLRLYDKAIKESDRAEELWKEASIKYKKLGKTYIGRVYSAIRYS